MSSGQTSGHRTGATVERCERRMRIPDGATDRHVQLLAACACAQRSRDVTARPRVAPTQSRLYVPPRMRTDCVTRAN